jgi:hypothetical protein
MLQWSDLSACHELRQNVGNDVRIRLLTEVLSRNKSYFLGPVRCEKLKR